MDLTEIQKQLEIDNLNKAEVAWNEKLSKEIKSEDDIILMIEDISNNLLLNNKIRTTVNNKNFIVGCKVANLPEVIFDPITKARKQVLTKTTVLIITNEDRYKLLGQQYVPAMVKSDYDERYDAKANIRAAVEGWIRHATDTIKPEMLDK